MVDKRNDTTLPYTLHGAQYLSIDPKTKDGKSGGNKVGIVTNVKWECPGCDEENIAQLYGDLYPEGDEKYSPLPRKAVPSNAELKWNPPCAGCGKYKLTEPPVVLVEFPIARVEEK